MFKKTQSIKTQNRDNHNKFVRARNLERGDVHDKLRIALAEIYIEGKGIEIGALHKPLNIPEHKAEVKYVDRLSVADLNKQYPEIGEPMVEPHYVDDGEKLKKIKNNSQDFVIACHFYEHCSNPLQTIQSLLRVVKKGGGIFLALPDKRYTFDIKRPITDFKHIVDDYEKGPSATKLQHFNEWVELVEGINDKAKKKERVHELIEMDYSIHYHVWDYDALCEHFGKAQTYFSNKFEICMIARNLSENLVYIKKLK